MTQSTRNQTLTTLFLVIASVVPQTAHALGAAVSDQVYDPCLDSDKVVKHTRQVDLVPGDFEISSEENGNRVSLTVDLEVVNEGADPYIQGATCMRSESTVTVEFEKISATGTDKKIEHTGLPTAINGEDFEDVTIAATLPLNNDEMDNLWLVTVTVDDSASVTEQDENNNEAQACYDAMARLFVDDAECE